MESKDMLALILIAFASVILRFGTYFLAMSLSHICAFSIHYDLRSRIASHIAMLPLGFFDRRASGEIKKTMGDDVENVELFIAHYLPDVAAAIVLPICTTALLFWVDTPLTLAALVPVPLAVAMHLGMHRVYRKNVGAFHDNVEKMNNAIVEYVRGMPIIKAFNQTAKSFRRYKNTLAEHLKISQDWNRRSSGYSSFFWVSLDIGLVFILPVGFLLLNDGLISSADMVLFLLLGPGLMEPVGRLIMITGLLDRIGEGIVRIQSILDQRALLEPARSAGPQRHMIEFKKVSFAYDQKNVLEDVSFVLPEGTLTGFVGPSGAGKSTAARLIPRFWDVAQGEILIGGRNIKDISSGELMSSIAFVFQDVYLMNDTVMENIRMGRTTSTDQEVLEAAQNAAAHEFIMELDHGYQTMVGEGGAYLSGGEKQRISIARAILKDAPILILDEATAFTDPGNEARIHGALNALMAGKTVIVIAHRLPTITNADQLLLFDRGRIKASGRHSELLNDPLYADLWSNCAQAAGWQLAVEVNSHV
jgi:ATP-binding cassette subfamily B protein